MSINAPKKKAAIEVPAKPVVRLKVVTIGTYIKCPYQDIAQIAASVCSLGSRTPTHPLCFRCPDGALFEEKNGGRTFQRRVVPETHPGSQSITFKVRVSEKKYGIKYTSAKLSADGSEVTLPFYETIMPGTFMTSREHHGPLSEAELENLARNAARARLTSRRGSSAAEPKKKSGGKKMVGPEMAALIEDKKRRQKMGGWYEDFKKRNPDVVGGKTTVTVKPGGKVININTAKFKQPSVFAGAQKKVRPSGPISTESLISKEAKRLSALAKKGK